MFGSDALGHPSGLNPYPEEHWSLIKTKHPAKTVLSFEEFQEAFPDASEVEVMRTKILFGNGQRKIILRVHPLAP